MDVQNCIGNGKFNEILLQSEKAIEVIKINIINEILC